MWFRKKREDTRALAWQTFAERLELEDASATSERMRRWLDLDDVALDPVYALRRERQPTLYLFEFERQRRGPAGAVSQRVSNCLLRADAAFASIALRVHPKRNAVLESLEASRTGSTMVDLPGPCGAGISVFARDPDRAARILAASVCRVLTRALEERGADSVVVGERHVLATLEVEESTAETTDKDPEGALSQRLDRLEALASDVLALYALLAAESAAAQLSES